MRGPQPWRIKRARVLRAHQTSAEDRLWNELRARRLDGLKFVRQAPIGPYFVDFLCRERNVVVEVDGGTHETTAETVADSAREAELRRLKYRILRIWNDEIYDNIDGVLDAILRFVREYG